tara:strand:- start:62 stop:283 length:222 start_codon:yes stop_codon:yes gene_type:complete
MEKARPKRKMNLEEIYKNDLMFLVLGKEYIAIKQRNDNNNQKSSINNSQEQRPDKLKPIRKCGNSKSFPSYPM